jgi:adenosylcobinamide-GDP ribazoletransferase
VQFLTRLPTPQGEFRLGAAVPWLPIVGLLLGAILAFGDAFARRLGAPLLLASTLDVVALLVLTGALHADGLMDTCDAAFGHASPQRRLEIMRDPHVGSFGVVGLVCVVALKIAALDALSGAVRPFLLLLAPGIGRLCIVFVAGWFPYGRPGGSGEPLKLGATPRAVILAAILPLAACALAGLIGLLSGAVAVACALGLALWLLRLLPGLTGDCYGALCEVAETTVWLSAALVLPRLAT